MNDPKTLKLICYLGFVCIAAFVASYVLLGGQAMPFEYGLDGYVHPDQYQFYVSARGHIRHDVSAQTYFISLGISFFGCIGGLLGYFAGKRLRDLQAGTGERGGSR